MTTDVAQRFKAVVSRPWPKWFKNLLASIFRAYFATLDATKVVAELEAHLRTLEPVQLPLAQRARFDGHWFALLDHFKERPVPPQYQSHMATMMASIPPFHTQLAETVGPLSFAERVVYFKEFAIAYGSTFTPMGEPRGGPDATLVHFQLLIHSMLWLATRPPRSVTEWHKWLLAQRPRPKLPPLEALRRQDREMRELRRLQQICGRIGLQFSAKQGKSRKHKVKAR